MVAVKILSALHRSAVYIVWSFGINELICGCSEYTAPLKDLVVGGLSISVMSVTIAAESCSDHVLQEMSQEVD